ncbi:transmembrane protein 223 [Lycorma delicatula]|uniref:transmembrane protein 223 n=1 Tax=Lycorma delicatula TaxID=130591 RepID=UPI003F512D48
MSLFIASCRYGISTRPCFNILRSCKFTLIRSVVTEFKRKVTSCNVLDVNTNVTKDVLLYKHDCTRHFKMLNLFAVGQFIFWNYLAETVFSTTKNIPEEEITKDGPWYTRFNPGKDVARYSLTAVCLIIGTGMLITAYFYTIRAVKYIVLKKGGQVVLLATHSPFGKERVLHVPVNQISAADHRASAKITIPLKVQGKSLFFILDKEGKFGNLMLFDATVGLRRKLSN